MALNQVYDEADPLKVPVPEGTESGDPVLIGKLPGTALTDRGDDGEATVKFGGGFRHPVTGKNGESNSAVAVGDAIFIDNEGALSKTSSGGTLYGFVMGLWPLERPTKSSSRSRRRKGG